jgi:hypothetical protein
MEWESVCVRSGVSQQEMVVECQIRDCRVEAVSGWVLRGCGEDARQTKKRVLKGGTWGEAGLLLLAGNSFTGGERSVGLPLGGISTEGSVKSADGSSE